VYYTSIASIITSDYFKTCLYHDDPLSGRQRVGRSLKPPLVYRRCHRAKVTVHACGCSEAVLYFAEYIAWFLFTIFTAYIVFVFLACFLQWRACDRFSVWSCSLKRALYNTPDSECLECYIYRLFTLDTMQKTGV